MRSRIYILIIAAGLMLALHLLVVEPLKTEHAKARAKARLQLAIASRNPVVISGRARDTLVDLDRHGKRFAADAEVHIDRAAAYMLLENYGAAIDQYHKALRFDRRPEIYFNLGDALINNGDRQGGVEALTRAILFNPTFRAHIRDGLSRVEVEKRIEDIAGQGGPCRNQRGEKLMSRSARSF